MQLIEQQIAGDRALDTGQELLENGERGRRDAVAMPECTPSVSTRTRSVPSRLPRSEVVHHT